MRSIIFILAAFIGFSLAISSCQTKTSDDELAERMAKSENFKMMMNFGKQIADKVKPMPDSAKNKMRKTKELIEKLQSNTTLNVKLKRDSIFKIIRSTPFYDSITMDSIY